VKKLIYLAIYVDHMILAMYYLRDLEQIHSKLAKHFEMNKAEDLNQFLGKKITRNRAKREIYLSQECMILDMFKKSALEKNANPAKTPMAKNKELTRAEPSLEDPRAVNVPYREVVGALIYDMLGT
jgi:hypothetical protein